MFLGKSKNIVKKSFTKYVNVIRLGCGVIITFKNRGLEKLINSEKALIKKYGPLIARLVMRRMVVLDAAPTLADVSHKPPTRRHQLSGKRKNQYAVDLVHPKRLVFRPCQSQIAEKSKDTSLRCITTIEILGVKDYH